MFLKEVIIKNFRGYDGMGVRMKVEDLTTLIGKNDIGKSTIFDALDIFFKKDGKIEDSDISINCNEEDEVRIACVFSNIPTPVIIDSDAITDLNKEYLLNKDGNLEIHKVYKISKGRASKFKAFAKANHSTLEDYKDLLNKTNTELKKIVTDKALDVDRLSSNVDIRKSIWEYAEKEHGGLQLQEQEIQIDKILEELSKYLPAYVLFRADRSSTDGDPEVQNPMKGAIELALKGAEEELEKVTKKIEFDAKKIAVGSIEQLKMLGDDLGDELSPEFGSVDWKKAFKLSIVGDNGIAMNKRGSGIRRLIIFCFFKAEAERIRYERVQENAREGSDNIIYAIEEPETSLHPDLQVKMIKSLQDLSNDERHQVMLTTHVPGIVESIPGESIRYIHKKEQASYVDDVYDGDKNEIMESITSDLGVLPDGKAKVLVCLEGPSDISFFKKISKLFSENNENVIDLSNDDRVAFISLGGATVRSWVNDYYLRNLKLKEFILLDKDDLNEDGKHKYHTLFDKVEKEKRGKICYTNKREIENYLSTDIINKAFGFHSNNKKIDFKIDNDCKVQNEVKKFLDKNKKGDEESLDIEKIKSMLQSNLRKITPKTLQEVGDYDEVKGWLVAITKMVEEATNSTN